MAIPANINIFYNIIYYIMSFKNKYLKYKSKYLQLHSDNTLAKIINNKYQLGGANTDELITFIKTKKDTNRFTENKYFVMLYGPPRNNNDDSPNLGIDIGIIDIITYEQHFASNKKGNNKDEIKSSFVDTRLTSNDIKLLNPNLKASIDTLIEKIIPITLIQSSTNEQQGGFAGIENIFTKAQEYIDKSDMSVKTLDTNEKRNQIDMLVHLLVTLGFYLNKNVNF